jgi:predicted permease
LFAVVLSVATVFLFGWAPALHAVGGNLRSAMHDGSGAAQASPGGRRVLRGLVGTEFALAALLLICGGLLLRAYDRVARVDPGFATDRVLTFRLALPEVGYPDNAARLSFWNRLLERLEALPGVEAAGAITCPPLGCHWGTFFVAEGQPPRKPDDSNPVVLYRYATPDYFDAMGIRIMSGRFFDAHDGGDEHNQVVVINQAFARTFFPGLKELVGRRIKRNDDEAPWITIVGVARDIQHYGLEREMRPGIYLPLADDPSASLAVALRTAGEPASALADARAVVRALDPELPLYEVQTMQQALRESLLVRAAYSWLLGVFAALALLLALAGTYGVTSYLVTQRTRELGIRIALGARRSDIVAVVLRGSLMVVAIGVTIGLAAAFGAARWLAGLLFGVAPYDLAILTAATTVLIATALAANWLPARRAALVDPMSTLRTE